MAVLFSLFRTVLLVVACIASIIALVNLYYLVVFPDADDVARDLRNLGWGTVVATVCGLAARHFGKLADAARERAYAAAVDAHADADAVDDRHDGRALEANLRLTVHVLFFAAVVAAGAGAAYGFSRSLNGKLLVVALLCLPVAAFLGANFLSQRPRGRPTLRIDADGIDHAWYGFVPWTAVVGLSRRVFGAGARASSQLVLLVEGPGRWTRKTPKLVRWAHGIAVRDDLAHGELVMPLGLLDVPADRIVAAARGFRDALGTPAIDHVFSGMTATDIARHRDFAEKRRGLEENERQLEAEMARRYAELADDPSPAAAEERRAIEECRASLAHARELMARR